MKQIKIFIENKDYKGIKQLLSDNPGNANEGIAIPFKNIPK